MILCIDMDKMEINSNPKFKTQKTGVITDYKDNISTTLSNPEEKKRKKKSITSINLLLN